MQMHVQNTKLPLFSSSQITFLKWVALLSMLVDHLFKINFPDSASALWGECIGRIAFPLFCLLLATNATQHTRKIDRYLLRLFVFAVISQPFYAMAFDSGQLNIFFTLAGSLLLIRNFTLYEQNPEKNYVSYCTP